jgi:hypothetical protein
MYRTQVIYPSRPLASLEERSKYYGDESSSAQLVGGLAAISAGAAGVARLEQLLHARAGCAAHAARAPHAAVCALVAQQMTARHQRCHHLRACIR